MLTLMGGIALCTPWCSATARSEFLISSNMQ